MILYAVKYSNYLVDYLGPLDVGVVIQSLLDHILVQNVRQEPGLEYVGLRRDGEAVVPRAVHHLEAENILLVKLLRLSVHGGSSGRVTLFIDIAIKYNF